MSELKPGPLTLAGLRWLAAVGPSPLGAWGLAMGWSRPVTCSHAKRLREVGWLGPEICLAGRNPAVRRVPCRSGMWLRQRYMPIRERHGFHH